MRPLVIGIGHPDRGDDHVGVEVARRVSDAGWEVDVLAWTGPPLLLLDRWRGRQVVLVDAIRSGRPPGSVVRLDEGAIASCRFPTSTHEMGMAEALVLARALGLEPASLTVVGLELAGHQVGDGMSREVSDAVTEAVAEVLACLDALATPRVLQGSVGTGTGSTALPVAGEGGQNGGAPPSMVEEGAAVDVAVDAGVIRRSDMAP